MQKTPIINRGATYCTFYALKIGKLFVALVFLAFAYHEYSNNNIWVHLLIISLAVLISADMLALPVYKLHNGIEFHHLWRVSRLKNNEIKWMKSGTWSLFKAHSKEGEVTVHAKAEGSWFILNFQADQKNGLEAYYCDLGLIKKFPKYDWGMSKPRATKKDGSDQ